MPLPSFMRLKIKKTLKFSEKRDDLVLKEVRLQKKFPKVKIGKIGMDNKHLSTLIIPIPNSEVNFIIILVK